MSGIPAEIAGVGSTTQKLRVRPGFDPMSAGVGPEEYFVLSRIDGTQPLREVLLATGLPPERCVAIVTKLRSIGALLLPGEKEGAVGASATKPSPSPTPAARPTAAAAPAQPRPSTQHSSVQRPSTAIPAQQRQPATPARATGQIPPQNSMRATGGIPAQNRGTSQQPAIRPTPSRPTNSESKPIEQVEPQIDTRLPDPSDAERAALAEDIQLEDHERRKILALARLSDGRNPWALLGVPEGSEPKLLKRAYFKLSKEIHPDRFYGKRIGSFGPRLAIVFEAVSRAYARLTNPDKARASGAFQAVTPDQPQTQQDYAAELFDRACSLEVSGEIENAMKLFSAAVRIDPQTKFLRRASICALRANQPKTALEYAKKAQSQAPDDPSCARLLATAFKAVGKLADAEDVLVMAMAMKSENDVLTSELRNDLAEVRRLLQAAP